MKTCITSTLTRIVQVTSEEDKYQLQFTQRLENVGILLHYSMFLNRESFNHISTALTITSLFGDGNAQPLFTLTSKDTLEVVFPISGCFGSLPDGLQFPFNAKIDNVNEKKANGIVALELYCEQTPNGYYFLEDYFVSSDLYRKLRKVLDLMDEQDSFLIVENQEVCFATLRIGVEGATIKDEFINEGTSSEDK